MMHLMEIFKLNGHRRWMQNNKQEPRNTKTCMYTSDYL